MHIDVRVMYIQVYYLKHWLLAINGNGKSAPTLAPSLWTILHNAYVRYDTIIIIIIILAVFIMQPLVLCVQNFAHMDNVI